MMKIGIFLEACGIYCSEKQTEKVEAFVDHFVKQHYVSKKDLEKKDVSEIDNDLANLNVVLLKNKENIEDSEDKENEIEIDFSECDICHVRGFGTKNLLDLHKELIHSAIMYGEAVPNSELRKIGRLTCPICTNVSSLEDIYGHIKTCAQNKVDNWVQASLKTINARPTCVYCRQIIPAVPKRSAHSEHLKVCKKRKEKCQKQQRIEVDLADIQCSESRRIDQIPKTVEIITENIGEHSYCETVESTINVDLADIRGETKIESVEEEIINAELVQHTSQDVIEKDDILQQAVTSAIKVAADSIVYTTEVFTEAPPPVIKKSIKKLESRDNVMFPVNVGNHFCPVCSLRFESALVRDVHEQMVHRNPEKLRIVETKAGRVDYWKCPVCTQDVGRDVLNHVQLCEIKANELRKGCPVCGKDWSKFLLAKPHKIRTAHSTFLKHVAYHDSDTPRPKRKPPSDIKRKKGGYMVSEEHICEPCNLRFLTSFKLQVHKEVVHKEPKPHPCEICGNRFRFEKTLREHLKKMHTDPNQPEIIQCELCNKICASKKSLSAHKTAHKEKDLDYACELCGKTGKGGKLAYRKHKRAHHGTKDKQCGHCDKCFITELRLEKHVKIVHTKPLKCNVCPKRYGMQKLLDYHVSAEHLGLKPFVCTMCNESFSRRHTLNKHIRGAHGTENKPFQCSSCSKTFKSTTKLEHHFARFHELRNVQSCPHCGKLYSRLKAHLETCNAKGAREIYQCGSCERNYLHKKKLTEHLNKTECGNFGQPTAHYVVKRAKFR